MSKIITHHSAARMVGVDALDPDKHTHCLVIGGSFPERFWSYSVGTLDEVTSERDKQDAGYIVEIDYLETEE